MIVDVNDEIRLDRGSIPLISINLKVFNVNALGTLILKAFCFLRLNQINKKQYF